MTRRSPSSASATVIAAWCRRSSRSKQGLHDTGTSYDRCTFDAGWTQRRKPENRCWHCTHKHLKVPTLIVLEARW